MTYEIPSSAKKYGESPEFTEITVPAKLTSLHDTKAGVWGQLQILSGSLKFIIPGPPLQTSILESGQAGIIRPLELHRVEMIGPVRFKIEFYK